MKKRKLLTALTLSLACTCVAFPLAACNETNDNAEQNGNTEQNGNEQTVYTKISEEGWKSAFSDESASNVTVTIVNKVTITDEDGVDKRTENVTMKRSGNVLYQGITTTGSEYVAEFYFSIENDIYYTYYKSDDDWKKRKEDNGTALDEIIMGTDMFYDRYADAVFNAQTDEYTLPSAKDDEERDGVWTIKFADGKVSDILFEGTGYMYDKTPYDVIYSSYFSDYGTTSVTLPQATVEE